MGLPGLNDRELADTARLKRLDLKVILMTGYAESATLTKGVSTTGMTLLTKPFAMNVLSDTIRQLIDGGASAKDK